MAEIEKEKEYREELFRLMRENPDLPIVLWWIVRLFATTATTAGSELGATVISENTSSQTNAYISVRTTTPRRSIRFYQ